ncbi:hypothetical protein TcasGA2_TC000007 [Tribolium castaneum]|uniref:DUF4817 domain-containing protein n=1 Tax=Tribolium castaneum TaxID=7070 RepID=D7EKQ3_TRICA|nr:hypothetical protein TcasGA2_TC000007 [Tribolium castaneum]
MDRAYSFAELADIHLAYGKCNGNALATRRYLARNFQIDESLRLMVVSLDRRFRETESLRLK